LWPARQVCEATPRPRYEGREPAGRSGGPARDGRATSATTIEGRSSAIDVRGAGAGGAVTASERGLHHNASSAALVTRAPPSPGHRSSRSAGRSTSSRRFPERGAAAIIEGRCEARTPWRPSLDGPTKVAPSSAVNTGTRAELCSFPRRDITLAAPLRGTPRAMSRVLTFETGLRAL